MDMRELSGIPAQRGEVETALPAERLASVEFTAAKDYITLARMATMHVCGLLKLPIGRVTDLRLAVNEGCALFVEAGPAVAVPLTRSGGRNRLTVRFDRVDDLLRITIHGPAPRRQPVPDDLGWTMLCALVGEPSWWSRDGVGTLTMTEPLPHGL